jgi:hypothetical protein
MTVFGHLGAGLRMRPMFTHVSLMAAATAVLGALFATARPLRLDLAMLPFWIAGLWVYVYGRLQEEPILGNPMNREAPTRRHLRPLLGGTLGALTAIGLTGTFMLDAGAHWPGQELNASTLTAALIVGHLGVLLLSNRRWRSPTIASMRATLATPSFSVASV